MAASTHIRAIVDIAVPTTGNTVTLCRVFIAFSFCGYVTDVRFPTDEKTRLLKLKIEEILGTTISSSKPTQTI